MSAAPSFLSRTTAAFWGLVDPWLFLWLAASFLPGAIAEERRERGLAAALLSPSRLRAAWFARFWGRAGPGVREGAGAKVLPLLDGRTSGGRVLETPAGPGVGGVVVEIGPAAGLWVNVFAGRPEISRVYGVEPNDAHHAALRRAVEAAGLRDVYEIVPVGIEDLCRRDADGGEVAVAGKGKKKWDGNIEPGSVDCIVSVLCLCSIPEPERHIRELYRLLRPGGRWYVYEHVRCEYSWYIRFYQRIINLVWPFFIGGCQLCRPTEQTLRNAGPWSAIDVGQPPTEPWYQTLPHVTGVFTK